MLKLADEHTQGKRTYKEVQTEISLYHENRNSSEGELIDRISELAFRIWQVHLLVRVILEQQLYLFESI